MKAKWEEKWMLLKKLFCLLKKKYFPLIQTFPLLDSFSPQIIRLLSDKRKTKEKQRSEEGKKKWKKKNPKRLLLGLATKFSLIFFSFIKLSLPPPLLSFPQDKTKRKFPLEIYFKVKLEITFWGIFFNGERGSGYEWFWFLG